MNARTYRRMVNRLALHTAALVACGLFSVLTTGLHMPWGI
jgi:hypothetical protein